MADSDAGKPAAALISGSAADLDCWLWHRPPVGMIGQSGDNDVRSEFGAAIAPGVD